MLHEKIADEFLDRFIAAGRVDPPRQSARPGDRDGAADQRAHRDRVLGYVKIAASRAARCWLAARRRPTRLWRAAATSSRRSCARSPSAIASRRKRSSGRSSPCSPSSDDEEALHIANGTDYGLGSGLWTAQPAARAPRRARPARRHGLDQQLQARQPGLAVRRRRPVAATAARWASTRCANTRR